MSRIMLVDDDPDILKYCEAILVPRGYEVVTKSSGYNALDTLAAHTFDLLIVDVVMPEMTGFEFLKQLRQVRNNPTPVLMLTGRRSLDDVKKALTLGATDYMVKPLDKDIFIAKVESILGKLASNTPEVRFAESSPTGIAEISFPALIAAVSEMGITLRTQNQIERNLRIKLTTPIFQEIGIQTPPLRASICKPLNNNTDYRYEVFISFVGLDEAAMQKIRRWIAARALAARKVS